MQRETFFKFVRSTRMYLTVNGTLQDWHVGRSSPDNMHVLGDYDQFRGY